MFLPFLLVVQYTPRRFGDPKMSKPENKAFAIMFQKDYSAKFLECHLMLLSVIQHGGYMPDRVINLALQYVSTRYVSID